MSWKAFAIFLVFLIILMAGESGTGTICRAMCIIGEGGIWTVVLACGYSGEHPTGGKDNE